MLFLYDKNTTDFTTNGEPIHHVYDAHVKRDEGFYLEFKLVLDEAKEYQSIKEEMIISAMTPDGINYFRVYEVNPKSDHVEVIALQLFYYLDHRLVKPFKLTNASGQSAIQTFKSNFVSDVQPYTFSSSVTEKHDFQASTSETEENYLNALEVINRIATRYDSEFLLNGFDVRMVKRLGQRTNALLYEKKNISSFELDCNINSLVTRIHAKSKWTIGHDEPGYVERGNNDREISVVVDSPLINEYSQIYEREYVNNNCRTEQELINWAKLKYSTDNIDKPRRSIQMETNIIDDTPINYGDELVLKYLVHDIDEVIRCVGYDYDPIGKQFYEVTLGDWRDDFGTTISQSVNDVSERQKAQQELIKQTVNIIQSAANGINRIAYGPEPVPNPIDGDIWFKYTLDRPNEVTMWIYNAELGRWEDKTPVSSRIDNAIEEVFNQFDTERTETEQAINEALDSAKAEAERLDNERQLIIDGKFEEVNNANEALEQSIATAEQNAQDALTKAGASEDLAKTAKEISENALANIGTVSTELSEVKTQASDSLIKAQEALNATGTLSTQVQSYEETVDGYKSEVANYSRTNETLTAKVKSYEETVDGYSQSLTRVEGKVDNLEVGGRNYWALIKKPWFGYLRHLGDGVFTNTSTGRAFAFMTMSKLGVDIGEDYTLSFEIKVSDDTIQFVNNQLYVNSLIPKETHNKPTLIKDKWVKVISTFNYSAENKTLARIYFTTVPSVNSIEFRNFQLEKGNIATDWTLAEEDKVSQSEYTIYKNQVKSTTDEHTRRLTAIDGDGGRISKVEQTASQIQTSLSSYAKTSYVDTQITNKAGEITTNLTKLIPTDTVSKTEFQTVKETTSLYERIIGSTETNVKSNIAKITMADSLFQTEVGKYSEKPRNLLYDPLNLSKYNRIGSHNLITLNNATGRLLRVTVTSVSSTTDTFNGVEFPLSTNSLSKGDYSFRIAVWVDTIPERGFSIRIFDKRGSNWYFQTHKPTTTGYQTFTGNFTLPNNVSGFDPMCFQVYLRGNGQIAIGHGVLVNSSIVPSEIYDSGDNFLTSQVTQLSDSWALTLKSGTDLKTAINATLDGVRLKGSLLTLDGQVNMTSSFIVPEGNIGNLSAKKITSGTIDSARIDAKTIVTNGLQANIIKSEHILANEALFTKLFTNDLATQKLATKQAWIKSSMIGDAQIGTAQIGQIDAGTGKIVNIDAQYITANHAKLVSAGFQGLNSNMHIDGGAIRIQNTAGDFATMNAIPEFRSQDSLGTAAIMGKGRSQYYSGNQSRFYIGSSLNGDEYNGSVVHGVHISKNQTWGIYRQSDSFGGTPAQYFKTPAGWGAVQVIEELMRTGKIVNNFSQASALIRGLNGWGNSFPVLQPGDMVMYQAAVPGNSSGIERILTMGTSSNGSTRTYSHVHHVFEGGTTGVSDARLKHDIKPTDIKALDHIADLSFKQFKWNRNDELEPLGLIAQESGILRVPDEEMEGIDLQRAMMLALKGIQELSQKLEKMGA